MSQCNICKRHLDVLGDPTTEDCGGDCLRCMAEVGGDPDCIKAMNDIRFDKLSDAIDRGIVECMAAQSSTTMAEKDAHIQQAIDELKRVKK